MQFLDGKEDRNTTFFLKIVSKGGSGGPCDLGGPPLRGGPSGLYSTWSGQIGLFD